METQSGTYYYIRIIKYRKEDAQRFFSFIMTRAYSILCTVSLGSVGRMIFLLVLRITLRYV